MTAVEFESFLSWVEEYPEEVMRFGEVVDYLPFIYCKIKIGSNTFTVDKDQLTLGEHTGKLDTYLSFWNLLNRAMNNKISDVLKCLRGGK